MSTEHNTLERRIETLARVPVGGWLNDPRRASFLGYSAAWSEPWEQAETDPYRPRFGEFMHAAAASATTPTDAELINRVCGAFGHAWTQPEGSFQHVENVLDIIETVWLPRYGPNEHNGVPIQHGTPDSHGKSWPDWGTDATGYAVFEGSTPSRWQWNVGNGNAHIDFSVSTGGGLCFNFGSSPDWSYGPHGCRVSVVPGTILRPHHLEEFAHFAKSWVTHLPWPERYLFILDELAALGCSAETVAIREALRLTDEAREVEDELAAHYMLLANRHSDARIRAAQRRNYYTAVPRYRLTTQRID